MAKGGRGYRLTDADIEEAIGQLVDMPRLKNARCPNGVSYIVVFERAKKNPALKALYDAAITARNAKLGIVVNTYTDADIDRAIALLNARPDDGAEFLLERARARGEHVPTDTTLRKHLQRRGGTHTAFEKQREKIRHKFASPAARLSHAPPATRLTLDQLRRPLRRNELFAKADALLPRSDSQDRDDIVSDMIVAMLEGRDANELRADRKAFIREHHRRVSSINMLSLDEELAPGATILDQLRNDDVIYEAAF